MEERTKEVDLVVLMIILHEELVTIDDMLAEIPREHLIENPGRSTEYRRDDARLKIGPDAWLQYTLSSVKTWGEGLGGTFLVIGHLRIRVILLQHGIELNNIRILIETSVTG
jgi:hypothetical protein